MPELSKGIYFVVQRAIKSIWYGEPAPIQEAIAHVQMEKGLDLGEYCEVFVKQALAQYANLIIRKIVTLENDQLVKDLISWDEMRLRTDITRGLSNLEEFRKEEHQLSRSIRNQEQIVRELRKRKDYLDKQEKSLTKRLVELQENEQHVQSELKRVNALSPVEVNRCLEIVSSLAHRLDEQQSGN